MTVNNNQKILITGGAGYIGSHIALLLIEKGYDIVILDDLSTGSIDAILTDDFYQGDIADRNLLKKIFSEHNINGVMHFAGVILVGESVIKPIEYYQVNFSKTIILLDEMIKHNVKNFIFSSTAAVFGEPSYTPIDTKHPKNPINPYGRSKLMLEQALNDFEKAYKLRYASLRYFNAAGADPKGKIGFHEPTTHLIPQVLKAASGRMNAFSIYGTDYNTNDGTCIRDYIHVMDLAQAHILAFEKLLSNEKSCSYNLGNNLGFSILEVVNAVKKVTNTEFEVISSNRRYGDPAILVADSKETGVSHFDFT